METPRRPWAPRIPAQTTATPPRVCARSNKVRSDLAVARIRARGRLIVGLDIGSNLLSFRDPITGDITGFDVDIAGEVARDIFGTPSKVEYRILASADRITALQTNTVDIVVKTMTVTCERRELVNFSTVYFNGYQRILAPASRISTRHPTYRVRRCAWRGEPPRWSGQQITPQPVIVSVVTWADCLVALQQREVDAISTDDAILAGLMAQDPYPHIVGPRHGAEPVRHRNESGQHSARPIRQRNTRANPSRRHLEHPVPQVVDCTWTRTRAARREVRRLMNQQQDTKEETVGTQPASPDELAMDSMSTMRPMSTGPSSGRNSMTTTTIPSSASEPNPRTSTTPPWPGYRRPPGGSAAGWSRSGVSARSTRSRH